MNHPHELLAEYVDGALPEGERTIVEKHLQGCAECRADERVARGARSALASLRDGPVPSGLAAAALAESRGRPSSARSPAWYRLAGLAAAASLVILLAVALPRLGSNDPALDASPQSLAAETDGKASAPEDLRLESRDADFDETALGQLAAGAQTQGSSSGMLDGASDTQRKADEVVDCLHSAFPDLDGRPIQLIRARFAGRAAFIGVFRTSAEGQGVPDSQVAIAVSVRRCLLLSFARASI